MFFVASQVKKRTTEILTDKNLKNGNLIPLILVIVYILGIGTYKIVLTHTFFIYPFLNKNASIYIELVPMMIFMFYFLIIILSSIVTSLLLRKILLDKFAIYLAKKTQKQNIDIKQISEKELNNKKFIKSNFDNNITNGFLDLQNENIIHRTLFDNQELQ